MFEQDDVFSDLQQANKNSLHLLSPNIEMDIQLLFQMLDVCITCMIITL